MRKLLSVAEEVLPQHMLYTTVVIFLVVL